MKTFYAKYFIKTCFIFLAVFINANIVFCQTPLSYGGSINTTISVNSEVDLYSFNADSGDFVIIRMVSSEIWPEIELVEPLPGGIIIRDEFSSSDTRIDEPLTKTGTYNIRAKAHDTNTGSYTLSIQKANIPPISTLLQIETSITIDASLDFESEMDAYIFSVTPVSSVQIVMGSSIFWPRIELFDDKGNSLASDWSSSQAEINAVISEPGCYTIIAMHDAFPEIGSYSLNFNLIGNYSNECSASGENCSNGVDDDGDNLVDCEDPDCSPVISSVNQINPNPPDFNDGQITINAFGQGLEYSINSGLEYFNGNVFLGLGPGTYNIRVRNPTSGCFTDYSGNPVVFIGDVPCVAPGFEWLNPPVSTCPESPVTLCLEAADVNFNFALYSNGSQIGMPLGGNGTVLCFDPISITEQRSFYLQATLKTDPACFFVGPSTMIDIGDLSLSYNTVAENGSNSNGRIDLCIESGAPPFNVAYSPERGDIQFVSSLNCFNGVEFTNLRSEYYEFIVTDGNGCTGTEVIKVDNTEQERIGFPEKPLLTPNDDGMNDELVFSGLFEFHDNNELIIYNRYGSIVFQEKPYRNQWDGTWNGKNAPADTYYYTLRVFQPEEVVYTGFVTVVR